MREKSEVKLLKLTSGYYDQNNEKIPKIILNHNVERSSITNLFKFNDIKNEIYSLSSS